jgi:predicted nucleic acid-binding protein
MPRPDRAVVDASVGVKWLIPEKDSARALTLRQSIRLAPEAFDAECLNALWANTRQGNITRSFAEDGARALRLAPVTRRSHQDFLDEALRFAFELDHPVYDCLYIALAADEGIPVITADERFLSRISRHPQHAARVLPPSSIPVE